MRYSELLESTKKEKNLHDLKHYRKLTSCENINLANLGLTSLAGSPEMVTKYFTCYDNKLKSLKGGPTKVGGFFNCHKNPLTDLIGAPITVGGDFLFGTPGSTISLDEITTTEIHGEFIGAGVVMNLMQLFKIKGITKVQLYSMPGVGDIMSRHITNPRGKLACQAEMISSGFKKYL